MSYAGDIRLGETIDLKFVTTTSAGVPTQLAGSPVISAYPGNSTTQLTAGITLSVDFDSVTGLNNVRVVATTGNGYATATNYQLVITTGTVGGVSVVGYVVGEFSIENRVENIGMTPILTGPYPHFGITDSGTAQSATATTLVLRAAAAIADDTIIGSLLMVYGSTQGYWQSRTLTDNALSGDTVTVDTWTVTPSGTITYILFGTPPNAALATGLATIATLQTMISGGAWTAAAMANVPSTLVDSTGSVTTTGTETSFTDSTITITGVDGLKDHLIYWTGGANVGRTQRVKTSTGTAVEAWPAMPNVCTSGDTYHRHIDANVNTGLVNSTPVVGTGAISDVWRALGQPGTGPA